MVNFKEIAMSSDDRTVIAPKEIFNRLRKPTYIDDLHSSQAEVLECWFNNRERHDTVIKLNTGGGKTLVGLLVALSSARELGEGALYLVENNQLAQQVVDQAQDFGIRAHRYMGKSSITSDFNNGDSILVASYTALFNGLSAFGTLSSSEPQEVAAIVIDDAHSSFEVVRNAFTTTIQADDNNELYCNICEHFRSSFEEIDRGTTLDEFVSGTGGIASDVLEVPFWAWADNYRNIAQLINEVAPAFICSDSTTANSIRFNWPLIKDELKYCRAIISREAISITPILPLIDKFPSFERAPRRIYMSATFADEGAVIRTFGCDGSNTNVIFPHTLVGVGRRMILQVDGKGPLYGTLINMMHVVAAEKKGVVVLGPSFADIQAWADKGVVPVLPEEVPSAVSRLRNEAFDLPIAFANRYNGIDLPGNSCRLLVISGIPKGMSDYQRLTSMTLSDSRVYARAIAQNIEQAIGRGTRGSGDYCVIVLYGRDLCNWIKDRHHSIYLSLPAQAQISFGQKVMDQITSADDFADVIRQGIADDHDLADSLTQYVANYIDSHESKTEEDLATFAETERKAFSAWRSGLNGNSIRLLDSFASSEGCGDNSIRGYSLQLAAQIEYLDHHAAASKVLQTRAHGINPSLIKAAVPIPIEDPSLQSTKLVGFIEEFERQKGDIVAKFNIDTIALAESAHATGYEIALEALGNYLGAKSKRFDKQGVGPDVLWVFEEEHLGIVLEAKNEKKSEKPFSKEEHGQLLVAREWFRYNYPGMECIATSVHPNAMANYNASANNTHVLTLEKIAELRDAVRMVLQLIQNSPKDTARRFTLCDGLLDQRSLRGRQIVKERMCLYSTS